MRKIIFKKEVSIMLLLLLFNISINAQKNVLQLKLTKDKDLTTDYIQKKAAQLHQYLQNYYGKSYPLISSTASRVDYKEDFSNTTNSVYLLSAVKYLEYLKTGNKCKELFICNPNCDGNNFFYATNMLANANSQISGLEDFNKITKIHFVDSKSTSGYVIPINFLSDNGVIDAPSDISIKSIVSSTNHKNIEIHYCESHDNVIRDIGNDTSGTEVGFSPKEFDSSNTYLKKILVCDNMSPGHIWIISVDLESYSEGIKKWIKDSLIQSVEFKNEFDIIKGLTPFNSIYKNACNQLQYSLNQIDDNKNNICIENKDESKMHFFEKICFWILVTLFVGIALYVIKKRVKHKKCLKEIRRINHLPVVIEIDETIAATNAANKKAQLQNMNVRNAEAKKSIKKGSYWLFIMFIEIIGFLIKLHIVPSIVAKDWLLTSYVISFIVLQVIIFFIIEKRKEISNATENFLINRGLIS